MKLTPIRTLVAGAALIVLANAVALTGVYLNRSGEPEARITLSQRELGSPWGWQAMRDNSGMVLGLNWRVNDGSAAEYSYGGYGYHDGTPEWLDEPHMKVLGFEGDAIEKDAAARRRFERQLPREVLLVLELAGPAWEQALQRARANADSKEFTEKARRAKEQLQREE